MQQQDDGEQPSQRDGHSQAVIDIFIVEKATIEPICVQVSDLVYEVFPPGSVPSDTRRYVLGNHCQAGQVCAVADLFDMTQRVIPGERDRYSQRRGVLRGTSPGLLLSRFPTPRPTPDRGDRWSARSPPREY